MASFIESFNTTASPSIISNSNFLYFSFKVKHLESCDSEILSSNVILLLSPNSFKLFSVPYVPDKINPGLSYSLNNDGIIIGPNKKLSFLLFVVILIGLILENDSSSL